MTSTRLARGPLWMHDDRIGHVLDDIQEEARLKRRPFVEPDPNYVLKIKEDFQRKKQRHLLPSAMGSPRKSIMLSRDNKSENPAAVLSEREDILGQREDLCEFLRAYTFQSPRKIAPATLLAPGERGREPFLTPQPPPPKPVFSYPTSPQFGPTSPREAAVNCPVIAPIFKTETAPTPSASAITTLDQILKSQFSVKQVIGDQITTIESEPDSSSQDLSRTLPTSSASVNLFYTLATGSGERQARANSSIHSEWSGADSDARHNGRYYSAKQEVKAKVDNRNQKLPILDLSFSEIAQMMDVFGKEPRSGILRIPVPPKDSEPLPDQASQRESHVDEDDLYYQYDNGSDLDAASRSGMTVIVAKDTHYSFPSDKSGYQQGPGEQRSPTPESETTRMTRLIKEHEMKTSIEGKLKAAGIKLAHNQLQSLSGWNQVTVSILHNWDQLAYLDLSSNHLVNVPDEILSLPLEALYLHSNAIVNFPECKKISALAKTMKTLSLYGNPVAAHKDYHCMLVYWLPNLRTLDFSTVTAKDHTLYHYLGKQNHQREAARRPRHVAAR
eukprot:CAMPEP_0174375096 /NCGR_PEP_ID=MMETSP0811_2-20130205/113295_1 /TAXON_ID=73025 ORGANISM="Eutreptiella gymnastica-like, Strain CCMP1594" /NCGR_SAMPLE_ID=MMETSP0811_2 /ASSEMBLY_ACC=CAM_ASM_000667 /LENGTH=556 /DNA_ID=CAMNT_0015524989 /DNA_START=92 /DNA_END=1762 /DNA_ORIENTATION=+